MPHTESLIRCWVSVSPLSHGSLGRLVFLSCGHKLMSFVPLELLVTDHREEHVPQPH